MPILTKVDNTYKVVFRVWIKNEDVWKEVTLIHYKFGNVWHVVHRPLLPFIYNETLTGTVYNYNLRQRAQIAGWTPDRPLIATINLNNCTMLAAVDGSYSFTTGINYLEGSSLTLNISANSKILGKGGRGGTGGGPTDATEGGSGGPAVFLNIPTTLNNLGVIGGGGGAGGGGGYAQVFTTTHSTLTTEGMGGAPGAGYGIGGVRGAYDYSKTQTGAGILETRFTVSTPATIANATENSTFVYGTQYDAYTGANWVAGTWGVMNYDSTGDYQYYVFQAGGRGGQGGLLGSSGTAGAPGVRVEPISPGFSNPVQAPGAPGGRGGRAIVGFSYCTVVNLGLIYGETL